MFMLWFLLISLVLGATVGVTYTGIKNASDNSKSKKNNDGAKEISTEEETQNTNIPKVKEKEKIATPEQQGKTQTVKKPVVATEPEKVIEGREAPTPIVIPVPQADKKAETDPEQETITPEKIAEVLLNEELMKKVVIPYAKLSKKSFVNIEDYASYFLQEGKFTTNEKGEKARSAEFEKKLDIINLLNDKDAMDIARLYAQERKQKFTRRVDIATFFITEKGNAVDSQHPKFEKTMKQISTSQKR